MTTPRKPTKRPTPIKPPEPIVFPVPKPVIQEVTQDIPRPETQTQRLGVPASAFFPVPMTEEGMKIFVQQYVREALDINNANLYHLLDRSEADIISMGEAQFQALMRDVRNAE